MDPPFYSKKDLPLIAQQWHAVSSKNKYFKIDSKNRRCELVDSNKKDALSKPLSIYVDCLRASIPEATDYDNLFLLKNSVSIVCSKYQNKLNSRWIFRRIIDFIFRWDTSKKNTLKDLHSFQALVNQKLALSTQSKWDQYQVRCTAQGMQAEELVESTIQNMVGGDQKDPEKKKDLIARLSHAAGAFLDSIEKDSEKDKEKMERCRTVKDLVYEVVTKKQQLTQVLQKEEPSFSLVEEVASQLEISMSQLKACQEGLKKDRKELETALQTQWKQCDQKARQQISNQLQSILMLTNSPNDLSWEDIVESITAQKAAFFQETERLYNHSACVSIQKDVQSLFEIITQCSSQKPSESSSFEAYKGSIETLKVKITRLTDSLERISNTFSSLKVNLHSAKEDRKRFIEVLHYQVKEAKEESQKQMKRTISDLILSSAGGITSRKNYEIWEVQLQPYLNQGINKAIDYLCSKGVIQDQDEYRKQMVEYCADLRSIFEKLFTDGINSCSVELDSDDSYESLIEYSAIIGERRKCLSSYQIQFNAFEEGGLRINEEREKILESDLLGMGVCLGSCLDYIHNKLNDSLPSPTLEVTAKARLFNSMSSQEIALSDTLIRQMEYRIKKYNKLREEIRELLIQQQTETDSIRLAWISNRFDEISVEIESILGSDSGLEVLNGQIQSVNKMTSSIKDVPFLDKLLPENLMKQLGLEYKDLSPLLNGSRNYASPATFLFQIEDLIEHVKSIEARGECILQVGCLLNSPGPSGHAIYLCLRPPYEFQDPNYVELAIKTSDLEEFKARIFAWQNFNPYQRFYRVLMLEQSNLSFSEEQ